MPELEEAQARELVRSAQVARLATVRPDGTPHVVPICFALTGDAIVSVVDHKPKRRADLVRLENVRAQPAVSLLVDHYTDDWTRLWWARADGNASVVDAGAAHDVAVDRLVAKYPQYAARRPSGAVVEITVVRWSGWRAAD